MCRKSTSPVATNLYTFRNERSDELGGMAEFLLQEETEDVKQEEQINYGVEGAFGQPRKFPVRETNIPSLRFTDKNESEWLESVAMTPQGIQSYLEEKEIVCLV